MNRFLICLLSVISYFQLWSQEVTKSNDYSLDVNYFRGNITVHNKSILHLISGHPEGVIIGWSKKTFGEQRWQQEYNYPDFGTSVIYQNLKSEVLGNNFGVYGHYNFYFFNRKMMFRIGQGLAYTSNPYHREDNHKNNAFGSKLLSSTYAMLNYKKEHLFKHIGIQAGVSLIHYSNANVKAPNTSVNIITVNAGVFYNFSDSENTYIISENKEKFTESLKYNVVFRTGINESDVIGTGQFPLYVFSTYIDKRVSFKSAFQIGADVFLSYFLREHIKYESVAFPDRETDADTDFKRVGLFVGHELFFNKLSIVTQAGYYAYYPYDFEGRVYVRVGLKRYFGKKWFAAISVKAHGTAAEAAELGVGIRL